MCRRVKDFRKGAEGFRAFGPYSQEWLRLATGACEQPQCGRLDAKLETFAGPKFLKLPKFRRIPKVVKFPIYSKFPK